MHILQEMMQLPYAPSRTKIAPMKKSIHKILAELMSQRGISQVELSRATGVGQSTISRILNPLSPKGIREPKDKQVRPLADYFGVSTDQMRGYAPIDAALPADHQSNTQGVVIAVKGGSVPVVGLAKLGADGYFEAIDYPPGHGDGRVLISSSDPNAYALKVVGDSMEPRIRSGEFVLIEPGKPYLSGDEVMVQFNDGVTVQSVIKVFMHERDGFVRLLSVNDAHPPMTIERARILKIHPVGAIIKPSRYVVD